MDYLFRTLNENSELKKDFLDYLSIKSNKGNNKINQDIFFKFIKDSYDECVTEMESLNLEDTDWENYVPPHSGYIPEWEAAQYMAEEEANDLFGYMKEHLVSLLIKNNIESVVAELIAFYFASKEADIKDPYNNLGDPANDYFIEMHKEFTDYAIEKISISSLPDSSLIDVITLFFKYFEIKRKDDFKNIKVFENILLAMLNNINNKENIKQLNNITKINKKYYPQYSLQLQKKLGNKKSWLENAKQFYLIDKKIGGELLEYYYKQDIRKYISTAKELFHNEKKYWAEKLDGKLKMKHDQQLYKDVYTQLCINKNRISDYKKIEEILTEKDKENLHRKLQWSNQYRVEIYVEEKQYEKIKELVKQNPESRSFDKLIKPILHIYPGFCFKTIENAINDTLSNHKGREIYRTIARWIKVAKRIPDYQYQIQTQKLISQLYNHKPTLPALRDEMRKAGVV